MRAEDDAADRGDEQDDRRDLEREQVVGQEQPADLGGAAEARSPIVASSARELAAGLEPDHDDDLDEQRAAPASTAPTVCQLGPACPRRVGSRADVGDDEQEHHHHGAGVDEHLRGRDELGRQQQVEHGERAEVPDQRERRVERVRERDDRDGGAEARERGDDPHDPDDDVAGRRDDHEWSCSTGSACRRGSGRRRGPS